MSGLGASIAYENITTSGFGFGMNGILESGEEEDIFSPEFLEKLSDVKMPATKLELLVKMLRKQIKEFGKINQIAAQSFQEMLERTIAEYHERRKTLSAEEADGGGHQGIWRDPRGGCCCSF